jgi:hypothetical protein
MKKTLFRNFVDRLFQSLKTVEMKLLHRSEIGEIAEFLNILKHRNNGFELVQKMKLDQLC